MNRDMLQKRLDSNPFAKLSDVVTDVLFDEIVSLNLTPASKLNVNQIAKELGISRTPVQEALVKLADTGLAETRPGCGGYYVAPLSVCRFTELYHARAALESEAAYLCAEWADDTLMANLDKAAHACEQALAGGDMQALQAAEQHFHRTVMECSRNSFLIECFAALMPELTRYQNYCIRCLSQSPSGLRNATARRQMGVASAIRLHMPEVARQLMRENLLNRIAFAAFFGENTVHCH